MSVILVKCFASATPFGATESKKENATKRRGRNIVHKPQSIIQCIGRNLGTLGNSYKIYNREYFANEEGQYSLRWMEEESGSEKVASGNTKCHLYYMFEAPKR